MNEIIKFCNLNDEDISSLWADGKVNLKRQDVYIYENQIYFVEKNDFKYRIKKIILKLKTEIKKWFEKQNEINLLVR